MIRRADLMVGVSGIRGIVWSGMNPEIAVRFTAAFASRLPGGLVVVGRDTRASGPLIADAVFSALRFKGFTAIDLGIASTPTVEIMVDELGASGGIIITASHNGPEWNALKFLDTRGEFLSAAAMDDISARAFSAPADTGTGSPGPAAASLFDAVSSFGPLVSNGEGDAVHIKRILELPRIDREAVASRRYAAVVDCVNGAGSRIVPALLRSLGVEVVELYTDVGAPFPHEAEPRPQNLVELARAVPAAGADLGFACDPDADRLVLVDGSGNVCSEELTLALAADFVLREEKGPLVANLSTSRLIDDIGAKHGVAVRRSKVGEAHVTQLMKESGAAVGGEGNGGVIYPPLHYGRDAMVGIALILQSLAAEGMSLAAKVASLPSYHIVKEKLNFQGDFAEVEKSAQKRFPGRFTTLDGIRIDMEGWWIHLRRSNTEPVVRVIAEARSPEEARALARAAGDILGVS